MKINKIINQYDRNHFIKKERRNLNMNNYEKSYFRSRIIKENIEINIYLRPTKFTYSIKRK